MTYYNKQEYTSGPLQPQKVATAEVRASLRRSFAQVLAPERTDRQPVERCRRFGARAHIAGETPTEKETSSFCPASVGHQRVRLHFLLAFLHAVVLERLRFFPVGSSTLESCRLLVVATAQEIAGWSKKYEFSDADQTCGQGRSRCRDSSLPCMCTWGPWGPVTPVTPRPRHHRCVG